MFYKNLLFWLKNDSKQKKEKRDHKFYECVMVYKKLKNNKDITGFL